MSGTSGRSADTLYDVWLNRRPEKRPDRGAGVDAADRLADQHRHRQLAEVGKGALLLAEPDRVGRDQLDDGAVAESLDGRAREDRVDAAGVDAVGALLFEQLHRADDGTGGVDLVVDDDGALAPHVADELERLSGAGVVAAALLDDGQGCANQLGEVARLFGESDVGRDHHRLEQVELPEILGQQVDGRQLVDRNLEEALDLTGVQIEGQDAVGAGDLDHVRDQAGRDGDARLILLVGPPVGEVGDDRRHAAGRGALQRVQHDQQLHDAAVDVGVGRLNNENVLLADVLIDLDEDILVAELKDFRLTEVDPQVLADCTRKRGVGAAGEERQIAVQGHLRACSAGRRFGHPDYSMTIFTPAMRRRGRWIKGVSRKARARLRGRGDDRRGRLLG